MLIATQLKKAITDLDDIHKSKVEMVMKPDWNVEMIKEGLKERDPSEIDRNMIEKIIQKLEEILEGL